MPRLGVSITKSISFRGSAQEFSNTYYYNTLNAVGSAIAEGLIDDIVSLERPMHGSNVSFVRAKCWLTGTGSQSTNEMLFQKNLTGVGTNASASPVNHDRERAFLVRFRAGVDSKGRPVYLRKWWHLEINAINTVPVSNAMLQQTEQLTSTQRAQLVTWGNNFKDRTVLGASFNLVSQNGRQITGDTTAHPYFEHHQLGDMWR
jgi:hypothetical protein